MTAEAIARVVADLNAGRVQALHDRGLTAKAVASIRSDAKTVDATALYRALVDRGEPVALYEDHPSIAPPFTAANYCYVNEHGNVIVMHSIAHDRDVAEGYIGARGLEGSLRNRLGHRDESQPWEPAQPVEWGRVRWVIQTYVFFGGRGTPGPMPTAGPGHLWMFAIYEDGEPADLHWIQVEPDYPMEHWDMAHLVLLGAMNYLNCTNIGLVEPDRPRAERRRIERAAPGVTVHTINVFPAGKARRSGDRGEPIGGPVSSVRGHFSHYGPKYGRGLLFGKHEGRFFIPQHARGSAEHGVRDTDYLLSPKEA